MEASDEPSQPPVCPLCHSGGPLFYEDRDGKRYFRCPGCGLVWLSRRNRLSREAEFRHYRTHQNRPSDHRYRRFLRQLWAPLQERLAPGSHGLDYGSGPGPTLHLMAQEDGFSCDFHDPFFAPRSELLELSYDFVTCTETAEHFHHPDREFGQLHRLLRPSGWLGLMTLRFADPANFAHWSYRNDPTHVVFYQEATFAWIADHFGFAPPVFVSDRVTLMRKLP